MKQIQDNLKEFLANPEQKICNVGGLYKAEDFNSLMKVMNQTEEDFLIFDNGGGKKFDILFDRTANDTFYPIKDFIDYLLIERKSWIYSYQIDKQQTILKKII